MERAASRGRHVRLGLAAELAKGLGVRERWELVPRGVKHHQSPQGGSGGDITARPEFFPASSVQRFTPCLYKHFLYQFGYDLLMMTMFASKDCTS